MCNRVVMNVAYIEYRHVITHLCNTELYIDIIGTWEWAILTL